MEFTPNSPRHWTRTKYWEKLNKVGQGIISCGEDSARTYLPDLIGLCEVENDSTMIYLTQRSLLRKARYQYIMTASNDRRGIDVALLYSPFTFRIIKADTIRIPPLKRYETYSRHTSRNGRTRKWRYIARHSCTRTKPFRWYCLL